jgi:hypothetical protein
MTSLKNAADNIAEIANTDHFFAGENAERYSNPCLNMLHQGNTREAFLIAEKLS